MAKVSATVCNVERSRTSCQNVETEFMTPSATVLHNLNHFCTLRVQAAATSYFSTSYVAHYRQLVDSYIYPKLPELYVTKTRGFVFNAARTIDCIENHGCNEAIKCTTL